LHYKLTNHNRPIIPIINTIKKKTPIPHKMVEKSVRDNLIERYQYKIIDGRALAKGISDGLKERIAQR
jgi:hypothetical protein